MLVISGVTLLLVFLIFIVVVIMLKKVCNLEAYSNCKLLTPATFTDTFDDSRMKVDIDLCPKCKKGKIVYGGIELDTIALSGFSIYACTNCEYDDRTFLDFKDSFFDVIEDMIADVKNEKDKEKLEELKEACKDKVILRTIVLDILKNVNCLSEDLDELFCTEAENKIKNGLLLAQGDA